MPVKVMSIEEYISVMSARQVPMLPTSPLHMDSEIESGGLQNAWVIIGWLVSEGLGPLKVNDNYTLGIHPIEMNQDGYHEVDIAEGYNKKSSGSYPDWIRCNFDYRKRIFGLKEAQDLVKAGVFVYWNDEEWSDSYTEGGHIKQHSSVRSIYLGCWLRTGVGVDFERETRESLENLKPLVSDLGEPRVFVDGDNSTRHDIG